MKQALIVAFAFGKPYSILSNRRIAEIAIKKAKELDAEIFTQYDVLIKADLEFQYIDKINKEVPTTLGLARKAVEYAVKEKYKNIWVAAALPHLSRCMRDMWCVIHELKVVGLNVFVCEGSEQYPENEWYCVDSEQKHTRSKEEWELREDLIKEIPLCFYKLVAG